MKEFPSKYPYAGLPVFVSTILIREEISPEKAKVMVLDSDPELSSWEWDFVNDMSDKIAAGETFSAKQTETIVRIWEEKV